MARFTNFTVANQRLGAIWLLPWCILMAGCGFWMVWMSRSFSYCLSLVCFAWFMLCLLGLLHQIIWPENNVDYISQNISEADVLELRKLKRIHRLYLGEAHLTPSGFQALAKLPAVEQLNLTETNLTDEESSFLSSMKGLQLLSLDYTQITDATLEHLAGMTSLRCVTLEGTGVTEEGKEKLRKSNFGLFTDESYWN